MNRIKNLNKKIVSLLCIIFMMSTTVINVNAFDWGSLIKDKVNQIIQNSEEQKVADLFAYDGTRLYLAFSFEDMWKKAVETCKKGETASVKVVLYKDVDADKDKGFGVHDSNDTYGAFGENGEIVVPQGCDITIDLNGYHINRNLSDLASQSGNKRIFKVDGGRLNLTSSANNGCYCFIEYGRASKGGGIYVTNEGILILGEYADVYGNYADEGGGIYVEKGSFLMTTKKAYIDSNDAKRGGGIYNKGDFKISGTTIDGNDAIENGGGIYNDGGKNLIESGNIYANKAEGKGGAVYAKTGSIYFGDKTEMYNNVSYDQGAGIYVETKSDLTFSGKIWIQNNDITKDYATVGSSNIALACEESGDSCSGVKKTFAKINVLTLKEGSKIGVHPIKFDDESYNDGVEIISKINDDSLKYIHFDYDIMKRIDSKFSASKLELGDRKGFLKLNTTGSIITMGNVRIRFIVIAIVLGLVIGVFIGLVKRKKELVEVNKNDK